MDGIVFVVHADDTTRDASARGPGLPRVWFAAHAHVVGKVVDDEGSPHHRLVSSQLHFPVHHVEVGVATAELDVAEITC